MRILLVIALSLAATLAFPALASAPLSYDDARHLLNRTGFGATDAEIRHYTGMSRESAALQLLAATRTTAITPPPPWATEPEPLRYPHGGVNAPEMARKQFQQQQIREGMQLRGWWAAEMLTTASPLTEHMTLFWHNHFVSSQQKVKFAELMYRQNVTLRANALGHFGDLLHAIARDPAMVIYLDNAQNRKGAPNENFAREVMELFTLGEGNYSEQDIKEAARAFTGWSVDRDNGSFVFRRLIHDYGSKTVLGRSGNLDGDDVLDVLLAQPATAEFITRKLWREFVSPDPDAPTVTRIANRFRNTRYDIKVVLYELLTSDAFYSKENRGVLIKSPIDLVIGSLRQFDLKPTETVPFAVAAAAMGQNLFSPPNVKGWPGGEAWINSSTLLARKQFLDRLFRADDPAGEMVTASASAAARVPKQIIAAGGVQESDDERRVRFMRAIDHGLRSVQFASDTWFAQLKATDATRADAAMRLLLAYAPQSAPDPGSESLAIVRHIVLDAAYQLK
jgi:uncharacterized protein (DUF1800 family)